MASNATASQTEAPKSGAITVKENKEKILSLVNRPVFKDQLLAALMNRMTPDFMIRAAVAYMNADDRIQLCTPITVASSLLVLAQAGLEPEQAKGHGYLVPRKHKDSNIWYCTPMIGYRGFVVLAYRGGFVALAHAHPVYEADIFDIDLGSGQPPVHKPWIKPTPEWPERGEILGAYASVQLKASGAFLVEWMTKAQIDEIRKRSQSSAWASDFPEMARKTPFRRIFKWIPDEGLQAVAALDEASDFGKLESIIDGETGEIINVIRPDREEPEPIKEPQRVQTNKPPIVVNTTQTVPQQSGVVREYTVDTSVNQETEEPDSRDKNTNPKGKHISKAQVKRIFAMLRGAQLKAEQGKGPKVPTDDEFKAYVRELGYPDVRFIEADKHKVYEDVCAFAEQGTLAVKNGENW